jgi:hypothetical protein
MVYIRDRDDGAKDDQRTKWRCGQNELNVPELRVRQAARGQ